MVSARLLQTFQAGAVSLLNLNQRTWDLIPGDRNYR